MAILISNKIGPIAASDSIKLSSIGYLTKVITGPMLSDSIIYMSPKSVLIDEIKVGAHFLSKSIEFEELAPMKHGVFFSGAVVVDDNIYVIGGDESIKRVNEDEYDWAKNNGLMQIYDINADEWILSPHQFSDRACHNIHYHNDKIYVLGGKRLAKNPKLEYLNDEIEVYDMKKDTIYSSNSNPHQAIHFASGVFGDNLIVINGSTKEYKYKKRYTNKAHLLDLNTGFWYELNDSPSAFETTGIAVDSLLYLIGGYKDEYLSYIMRYNVLTEKQDTLGIWDDSLSLKKPALAYDESQKIIYIYENESLLSYNTYTNELYAFHIDLDLMYSQMVCKEDYLYIIGGQTLGSRSNQRGFEVLSLPSQRLIRIDLKKMNHTMTVHQEF